VSALPLKADVQGGKREVRFVPVADMENFYFPNKKTPNIAGVRVELRAPSEHHRPRLYPKASVA
jgi:hypothetical protein